jgi:hypothetical protein
VEQGSRSAKQDQQGEEERGPAMIRPIWFVLGFILVSWAVVVLLVWAGIKIIRYFT